MELGMKILEWLSDNLAVVSLVLSFLTLMLSIYTLWLNGERVKKEKEVEFLLDWHRELEEKFYAYYYTSDNYIAYLNKYTQFMSVGEIEKYELKKIEEYTKNILYDSAYLLRVLWKVDGEDTRATDSVDNVRKVVTEFSDFMYNKFDTLLALSRKEELDNEIKTTHKKLVEYRNESFRECNKVLNILQSRAVKLVVRKDTIEEFKVDTWKNHD